MGQDKQFEEIVAYYRELLNEATRAKAEAQTQVDLTDARLRSLEAERDALQTALKNADERIRKLEMECAAANEPQAAPIEQPAANEPQAAPIEQPAEAPAEVPAVKPAEQPAEAEPDFEQQKEVLRRMEEELAELEERLKRGS